MTEPSLLNADTVAFGGSLAKLSLFSLVGDHSRSKCAVMACPAARTGRSAKRIELVATPVSVSFPPCRLAPRAFITMSDGTTFGVPFLPGFKADLTYHQFDSDFGGIDYGSEWDASLGFKFGPVSLLAKYANYEANLFAADTEKFWLQAEVNF